MNDKDKSIEYCCIWCHRALPANKTYATESGQTTCVNCRGLGIVLNKWNKPCKRQHSVDAPDARQSALKGESE